MRALVWACLHSWSELESFDVAAATEQEGIRHDLQRRKVDVALAFQRQPDKTAIERRIFFFHCIHHARVAVAHPGAATRYHERATIGLDADVPGLRRRLAEIELHLDRQAR